MATAETLFAAYHDRLLRYLSRAAGQTDRGRDLTQEVFLRVSRAAYGSDKTDFLDLLDSVRSLRDFRLEHFQHIADAMQSLAELERVTGAPLQEERQ